MTKKMIFDGFFYISSVFDKKILRYKFSFIKSLLVGIYLQKTVKLNLTSKRQINYFLKQFLNEFKYQICFKLLALTKYIGDMKV